VESSCECGNEPLGSIKRWEDIEWLPKRCIMHALAPLKKSLFAIGGI
jgi:hypothetical protein